LQRSAIEWDGGSVLMNYGIKAVWKAALREVETIQKSAKNIKSVRDSQRVAGRPNSPPPELLVAHLKSTSGLCK